VCQRGRTPPRTRTRAADVPYRCTPRPPTTPNPHPPPRATAHATHRYKVLLERSRHWIPRDAFEERVQQAIESPVSM
jgi:hypothetical protein